MSNKFFAKKTHLIFKKLREKHLVCIPYTLCSLIKNTFKNIVFDNISAPKFLRFTLCEIEKIFGTINDFVRHFRKSHWVVVGVGKGTTVLYRRKKHNNEIRT